MFRVWFDVKGDGIWLEGVSPLEQHPYERHLHKWLHMSDTPVSDSPTERYPCVRDLSVKPFYGHQRLWYLFILNRTESGCVCPCFVANEHNLKRVFLCVQSFVIIYYNHGFLNLKSQRSWANWLVLNVMNRQVADPALAKFAWGENLIFRTFIYRKDKLFTNNQVYNEGMPWIPQILTQPIHTHARARANTRH